MGYTSKFKGAEIDARLEKMVNVTYAELVALRDEGKLIAGQMYRMTDYDTTCTWENTQVAGHPFDLVLTALDNKTLDEKCSAIWSERDTDGYFANSNLPAWDVRYCLDNDKNRFDWAQQGGYVFNVLFNGMEFTCEYSGQEHELDGAIYHLWYAKINGEFAGAILTLTLSPKVGDTVYGSGTGSSIDFQTEVVRVIKQESGKGVIYRLIDESENNVSYDFKNIMFYYDKIQDYVYTFHDSNYNTDLSLNHYECRDNIIHNNKYVIFYCSTASYNVIKNCKNVVCSGNVSYSSAYYCDGLNITDSESVKIHANTYSIDIQNAQSVEVYNNVGNLNVKGRNSVIYVSTGSLDLRSLVAE